MTGRAFLDSNILLYAYGATDKKGIAQEACASPHALSVQVLNEFANVSRKKAHADWGWIETTLQSIAILAETILPLSIGVHRQGLALAERYQFSVYDGMIVAAALQLECDRLLSEDMQHGQIIEQRLTIWNPFA